MAVSAILLVEDQDNRASRSGIILDLGSRWGWLTTARPPWISAT
jgi:hypothetical protein